MADLMSTLLELEQWPSASDLANKIDPQALASLVLALAQELKQARQQAAELRTAIAKVAGQLLAQQVGAGDAATTPGPSVTTPGPSATTPGPSAAGPTTETWAWSKGDDRARAGGSRSRSRRRQDRPRESLKRSKERSAEDREVRERDRAFVQERVKRLQTEALQQRRLGADVEESRGRWRACCTFLGERGPVTSVGPWRHSHEKAVEDGDELVAAYNTGGDSAVQSAKVALLKRAAQEGGPPDKGDDAQQQEALVPAGGSGGSSTYPTEIEGPSKSSSTLGGYRACVSFPSSAKATYEGAKPRKPIPVKCPWRLGPRARAKAEADAAALCEVYGEGGEAAMQERKREMFRTADAEATASRLGRGKGDSLQSIFRSSSSTDALQGTEPEEPQPEVRPEGGDDLASRYGKGFKLLTGMGFAPGSGLGREGQGVRSPVGPADAEAAIATAARHIGLGFAETAGLGASPRGS